MTIEQAGNFLISSILVGIGFCIITVAILVINNLFHKYWKPVTWGFLPESMKGNYRFQYDYQDRYPVMGPEIPDPHEPKIEPKLDEKAKK